MRTFNISFDISDNEGNGVGYGNGDLKLSKEAAIDQLLDAIAFIRYNPNEERISCDNTQS